MLEELQVRCSLKETRTLRIVSHFADSQTCSGDSLPGWKLRKKEMQSTLTALKIGAAVNDSGYEVEKVEERKERELE